VNFDIGPKLVILPVAMLTWKDIIKRKLAQGDWLTIIANLVPLYGVWFLHWSPKEIFLVYCFESIIIGLFTILKLLITGLIKKEDDWMNQSKVVTKQPAFLFIFFFLFHYGLFITIQMGLFFSFSGIGKDSGMGIFNFFSKLPALLTPNVSLMLGIFTLSYTIRMVFEIILNGEYRTASLGSIMIQPYGRIFIQQVTVILGSIFLEFGAGKIFILIFVLIKIFFDVFIDLENRMKNTPPGQLNLPRQKSSD
jgi:hypothetical protein